MRELAAARVPMFPGLIFRKSLASLDKISNSFLKGFFVGLPLSLSGNHALHAAKVMARQGELRWSCQTSICQ